MDYDYDIIVIGGGAAGITASTQAAEAGARVALIERDKIGGACTWTGCVPSKALLRSAKVYSLARQLGEFGIDVHGDVHYDASQVMTYVRSIVMKVGYFDSEEYFEVRGIRVYYGPARFNDPSSVTVGDDTLRAKRFIVCTGSRPVVPPIPGLAGTDYMVSKDLFTLGYLPKSLAVLGGGSIGVEMGQAFRLLGTQVSVIEAKDRILPGEDEEAARTLEETLLNGGMKIYAGHTAVGCRKADGMTEITMEDREGRRTALSAERVLVAAGRTGEIEGLGLEAAGVRHTRAAIEADASMKTSADNIYACGDVVGPYKFTHTAEYQARIAVKNALEGRNLSADYSSVPWCTFTTPELARFGMTEAEARAQHGDGVVVVKADFKENDRAVTDRADFGLAKVICDRKGLIYGAHVVGECAGEIIHEYILARTLGIPLGDIVKAVHIYPTLSRTVAVTSAQFNRRVRLHNELPVAT